MRAGRLRHRCALLEERRLPDGMGGHKVEWVELRKVWAEIALPTGRTAVLAQQLTPVVTAEIRARLSTELIAGRRLVHGGVTYQIAASLPDNTNSMLRLLCSSVPHP